MWFGYEWPTQQAGPSNPAITGSCHSRCCLRQALGRQPVLSRQLPTESARPASAGLASSAVVQNSLRDLLWYRQKRHPDHHAEEKTSGARSGSVPAKRTTTFLKDPLSIDRVAPGSTTASSHTRNVPVIAERNLASISSRERTRAMTSSCAARAALCRVFLRTSAVAI